MVSLGRIVLATAFLSATLGIALSSAEAASELASVQGAWLEQSMTCDEVFVAGKKGMTFRKPVNIFAPAMIISGNKITTPGAVCRVSSVAPVGDKQQLSLSCSTMISDASIKALVAVRDGRLYRFTSETDPGSRYEHCGP